MRIGLLIGTLLMAHPLMADGSKDVQIGQFDFTVGQGTLVMVSEASPDKGLSDLYYTQSLDHTRSLIRSYTVRADTGGGISATPIHPSIAVRFDLDPDTNILVPKQMIYIDQDWDTPLVTYSKVDDTSIKVTSIVFNENGVIRFDFSANLIRFDLRKNIPIAGAKGATIEGRYSGKFPPFALQGPRVFPDR